ncbi:hypothetical protein ACQEVZ_08870 [Dactylosporangium sp. CA-152071]|uniref:hypothetical protein n=1 Tax=Dactylosporangium sp. CA-152071 TaxID=3239933 RepID=UPI003D8B08C0
MQSIIRWFTAGIALLAGVLVAPAPAAAATTLVYATFKGDAAADEELWLYQSTNGGTRYLNTWTGLSAVGCSGCRHGTAIPR